MADRELSGKSAQRARIVFHVPSLYSLGSITALDLVIVPRCDWIYRARGAVDTFHRPDDWRNDFGAKAEKAST